MNNSANQLKNISAALLILTLITGYSIIKSEIATDRINQLECEPSHLQQVAPETLQPPRVQDFDKISNFIEADRHYKLGGTWATLDNGFICNIK